MYPRPLFLALLCLPALAADGPLASTLQKLVEQHIAPGVVVLVADKDHILDIETAGQLSTRAGTPMRADGVFWIASMSKSLTGAALMMLVDEGKLSLDDSVEKYLPEFKNQPVKLADGSLRAPTHPITVREIMSHTSGLVLASEKSLKRMQVLKDDVIAYAQQPLRQDPGTKYEYNNCGINTGGRIIEVVSGLAYDDFMRQRLFEPLGMKDTTCWPDNAQAARLAHTSKSIKGGLEEIILDREAQREAILRFSGGVDVPPAVIQDMGFGISFEYGKHYAQPAGGYFSTAADLGKFCRMLLRGGELDGKRYLSEQAIRTLSTSQTQGVKVSPTESYGVGVSLKIKEDEGLAAGSFGHRGARRTVMWVDPKDGLTIVILVERFDMSSAEQKLFYDSILKAALTHFKR